MPWAAAQSDRSVDLPERLAEMGAEILTVDREPYGHEILLALPDGTVIDLDVDRNGMWLEATASAGETFSTDVLDRLLPNAVLQHPALERLQSATEVERYSWGFEVTGFDANGQPVESEFAADGNRL